MFSGLLLRELIANDDRAIPIAVKEDILKPRRKWIKLYGGLRWWLEFI